MSAEKIIEKFNWPLLGNEHIVEFLAKSILAKRIAGAYIFAGPEDLGKTTIADYFAYSLLCQEKTAKTIPCGECHSCKQNLSNRQKNEEDFASISPDFYHLKRDKDKKNISIEQVRKFIHSLEMSSFLNSFKVGLIKGAEHLNEEAANALLKTLEEPRKNVVMILITSNLDSLPATIVSRCQVLKFRPVKNETIYNYLIKQHNLNRVQAKNFSRLAQGRPALAVKLFQDNEFCKKYLEKAQVLVDFSKVDINGRFDLIASLFADKETGQESVRQTRRVLEVWQGIVRDLLLLNLGQGDLIQHEIISQELEACKRYFNLDKLIRLSEIIKQSEDHLRANVNPKLVLENIAISI